MALTLVRNEEGEVALLGPDNKRGKMVIGHYLPKVAIVL